MLELGILAFTGIFVTVTPLQAAVVFTALTSDLSAAQKNALAKKAVGIATALLFLFAIVGEGVLGAMGISFAAFRFAGGVLLFLIAVDMVFARESGGTTATAAERAEAYTRSDIAVFPLATPLIAGPGAIGAVILYSTEAATGNLNGASVAVYAALLSVMLLTYFILIFAAKIQRLLGVTGIQVLGRVMGIMLCALASQLIFDGLAASNLFG